MIRRSMLGLAMMLAAIPAMVAPAAAPTPDRRRRKPAPEPVREAHPIVPPYSPTRPRVMDYETAAKLARRDIRRAERAAKDGSLLKRSTE